MAEIKLEPSWLKVLAGEFSKPYMAELKAFLQAEKAAGMKVFPPSPLIFNALNSTPYDKVKVVILGQDPYHGEGQAHGLSFSVPHGIPIPPSLRNIYKELTQDVGIRRPLHGDLTAWAKQGVLLLNATLTVRANEAGSHQRRGWELFTDAIIAKLSSEKRGLVFLLWGSYARAKRSLLDISENLILESAHPSPLSAHNGFFGSAPFSKTNAYLVSQGTEAIDWNVQ